VNQPLHFREACNEGLVSLMTNCVCLLKLEYNGAFRGRVQPFKKF